MFNRKDKKINNSEPLKVWVLSLLGLSVFCLFSYVYLVRGAIVNIVARQNMELSLASLDSKVAVLEAEYFKAKSNVTPEQKFVMRDTKVLGLSLLTTGN